MADTDELLARIAAALERIAPAAGNDDGWQTAPAAYWDGQKVFALERLEAQSLEALTAIDSQKETVRANTLRHAQGHAAHDALLWGARGMGKSALVRAVVKDLQARGHDLLLVQAMADSLANLHLLFVLLEPVARPVILFIDDIGFGAGTEAARSLRSLLEGGARPRPPNVRLYVTSNRRHIVSRNMAEQDSPVNPRDTLDDQLALADRFGLSLGFHNCSQDDYLTIVGSYAKRYALAFDTEDALLWARQRGSRSGRVAWQYICEIAGRAGKALYGV